MSDEADDLLIPSAEGEDWIVFHTKPRCEKKLEALCRSKGVPAFLPCITRKHQYGARERAYEVPMFSGYLFARVPLHQQQWFRQNHYVANMLPVTDEAGFLQVLRGIHRALGEGLDLEVLPFLKPGTPVVVTAGPMKGLEAEIAEVEGRNRVVLRLEMLQKTVLLPTEAEYLKPRT